MVLRTGGYGTGCQGGQMQLGFQYIIKNKGIDSEQDYNYTAENGICWMAAAMRAAATLDSWKAVPANNEAQVRSCAQPSRSLPECCCQAACVLPPHASPPHLTTCVGIRASRW